MTDSQMDFLSRIRSIYNQFTKAEKKVADYVTKHPGEILFMSITELSDACGVGETSVFRFCRTLGLGGYQEFKMNVSLSLRAQSGDEEALSGNVGPDDSMNAVVQKVLQSNQRALGETADMLDLGALERVVALMSAARRIAFFGVGASLIAARKANNKFLRIEPKVICVEDAHMQAMIAATMTAEDVAVVFSYSGSTKDTNAVARLAKAGGAHVVAITRFQKSPLTEFTDVTLLCGANENPLQGGSSGADICQSFLTELLYTEYYRRNHEQCSRNNEKTSASVLNKLY